MRSILNISQRVNDALHAMAFMDVQGGKSTAQAIAKRLGVSQTYLAKVMQPLAKTGLLSAERGKTGGYTLAKPSLEIKVIDVYRVYEGDLPACQCLFSEPICDGKECPLHKMVAGADELVRRTMEETTIADLAESL